MAAAALLCLRTGCGHMTERRNVRMPEPKSALNDTSGSEREPLSSFRSYLVSDGTRRHLPISLTGSFIIVRSGSLIPAPL